MQVFIIGSPFETAESLDSKRLHKQILECDQIIQAILGRTTAWANHPCTKMYRDHPEWLYNYQLSLEYYSTGKYKSAIYWSLFADAIRPPFHTADYFNQMKRRLYTKNNTHYHQWSHLGESDVNWYYVDGAWLHYRNGKLITQNS